MCTTSQTTTRLCASAPLLSSGQWSSGEPRSSSRRRISLIRSPFSLHPFLLWFGPARASEHDIGLTTGRKVQDEKRGVCLGAFYVHSLVGSPAYRRSGLVSRCTPSQESHPPRHPRQEPEVGSWDCQCLLRLSVRKPVTRNLLPIRPKSCRGPASGTCMIWCR
jgi:hypothetical protein